MANFPSRETDIARLAQDVINGLRANPDVFPSPPFGPDELEQDLVTYGTRRDRALVSHAGAAQDTAAKDEALSTMVKKVKGELRYAEAVSHNDDGKLQLIGWGGRRAPTLTENQSPGQVITLEVVREGNGWVLLGWQEPFDGGEVSAYKVQRRKRDTGDWIDVGTAVEPEIMLNEQDPGVEWEYRVIAVNKTGEGPASNIVTSIH